MLTFIKTNIRLVESTLLLEQGYKHFFWKICWRRPLGNKYYKSKSGRRWVIYNGEIEASKIPNEWYSWMHYTQNNIENTHNIKKYNWQKEHSKPNRYSKLITTQKKIMRKIKKNTIAGKNKIYFLVYISQFLNSNYNYSDGKKK